MELLTELFAFLTDTVHYLNRQFGPAVFIPLSMVLAVAVIAQWNLYEKCGQPGYACLIPVWNFIAFLRIVGRPWWHMFLFLIPGYNIYLLVRVYIELCHSFRKYNILDYIAVIIFNGLYVFYLGLSVECHYYGPAYGRNNGQAAAQGGRRERKQEAAG